MAHLFQQRNRNVIPNFRSYSETLELGELDRAEKHHSRFSLSIKENLLSWQTEKSIASAADLLSSAFVAGVTHLEPIRRAAEFILDNYKLATILQVDIANRILEKHERASHETQLDGITTFLQDNTQDLIRERICRLRSILRRFDKDPIAYVELSRLYSILGQERSAKKNMLIAVHLAPDNRYVLRSFVRLFVHYGEAEFALGFMRKRRVTIHDPWLVSAEIALATLLGRAPLFAKHGKQMLTSNNFSPFSVTELSSGLGTLELLDGSRRKSRDLFRHSLIDPNDNSLAQIEWALSIDHLFDLELNKFNVKRNFEALALEAFNSGEWEKAVRYSESWFMDMPFSKRSIMLGSHVSSVVLDNLAASEVFCKAGLVVHPDDPPLLNNLAYTLALAGRVDEALSLIDRISLDKVQEDNTKICLIATRGLISFRKGDHDHGRILYSKAIDLAQRIKDSSYYQLALLNYAREEILCGSSKAHELIRTIRKMKIDPKWATVNILARKILALYERKFPSIKP